MKVIYKGTFISDRSLLTDIFNKTTVHCNGKYSLKMMTRGVMEREYENL